jgi:flagellar secretion chaperone FliS
MPIYSLEAMIPSNDDILFAAGSPAEAYRATQRATAPPRRLAELLYDAAIRLCREALDAFDADDFTRAGERLTRAQEIVHQLQARLGGAPAATAGPLVDTCGQVRCRLVEAGFYRSRQAIEQTLAMLVERRSAWGQDLALTMRKSSGWIG